MDNKRIDPKGREQHIEFRQKNYPYLVTSTGEALSTFKYRQPLLIDRIGEEYKPILDEFSSFIKLHFSPFVLLRTSDWDDLENIESELINTLRDFDALISNENLSEENFIVADIAAFHRHTSLDPIYSLTGHDRSGRWPSEVLGRTFVGTKKTGEVSLITLLTEWISVLLLSLLPIAIMLYTQSIWIGVGSFFIVAISYLLFVWKA